MPDEESYLNESLRKIAKGAGWASRAFSKNGVWILHNTGILRDFYIFPIKI